MRLSLAMMLLPVVACVGDIGPTPDSGGGQNHDAAVEDSGSPPPDSGSPDDSGIPDAGAPDSGVPDAGAPDAGPPDAGPDPCALARLCDDFERYDAGRPPAGPWTRNVQGTGTVTVDGTHAFSGTRSVHFTVDANLASQRAYIETRSATLFPLPAQHMFGRMMVWLEEVPVVMPQGPHWTTIQADGPTDPATSPTGITFATYRYGIQQHFLANYHDNTSPDCYRGSNVTPPVKRWACYEWEYDTPIERLRFWLDGVAQPMLNVDRTGQGCVNAPATYEWTGPQFNYLGLGIQLYQPSNIKMSYWIDDVAVGSVRQGCSTAPSPF